MKIPIGTPVGIPPSIGGGLVNQNVMRIVNALLLEVDDVFFNPRDELIHDTFGTTNAKIERKLCATEEKMKAIEGSNAFGLDATNAS